MSKTKEDKKARAVTKEEPASPAAVAVKYNCPFPVSGIVVEHKVHIYKTFAKSDFHSFRTMCEDMSPQWENKFAKDGVYTWTKSVKGEALDLIRLFGVLPNCPPQLLWDVLHDHEFRPAWDENMLEGHTVCELDDTNEIGYYAAKVGTFISDREFLNQRGWKHFGNGEYIIFNSTVPHNDVKEAKGSRVRAVSKVTGYLIRPWGSSGSTITYLTQVDPSGWIPSSIVNTIAEKMAPNVVEKLDKATQKYKPWVEKKGPAYKKTWEPCEADPWEVSMENKLHDFHTEHEAKAKKK